MAHGFICPRLLSLSWDTNTHNEHIYFQFDVQNGRGLHEGSHFHYKNQKHKQSEIHPKRPWSQGVLIKHMQTRCLPSPYAGITPQLHPRLPCASSTSNVWSLCIWLHTRLPPQRGTLSAPGGLVPLSGDGWEVNPLVRPRHALLSNLNSFVFLRCLSHLFYSCKLELVLLHNIFVWVL